METLTDNETIIIELIEKEKEAHTNFDMDKKPREYFSSSLLRYQGRSEDDIILYLINDTQRILNEQGKNIDIAAVVKSRSEGSPWKLGYQGALEILREFVDWIDIEDMKI